MVRTFGLKVTGGQLMNYAAHLYGIQSTYPDRGPGRLLKIFDNDVFITSYPRSGNTWVRFLLAGLLYPNVQVDYSNVEQYVPDIYQTNELLLRKMSAIRFLKSHEYFDPRYQNIIYIIRNPIDVVSSIFNTLRRLNLNFRYTSGEFTDRYLDGEFNGSFGAWDEHVNSWTCHEYHKKRFLLIRYEDLYMDAKGILCKIADFLGLSLTASLVDGILLRTTKERMQALYKKTGHQLSCDIGVFNAGFLEPSSENQSLLEIKDIDRLEKRFYSTMVRFGYTLT